MNNHTFITLAVSSSTGMDAYIRLTGEERNCTGIVVQQEAFGGSHCICNTTMRLYKEYYGIITSVGMRLEFA